MRSAVSSNLDKIKDYIYRRDCVNEECGEGFYNFLIITRPMFVDHLDEYINWKKQNGFSVMTLTVEYILGNPLKFGGYKPDNMAERIKRAIHTVKDRNHVKFVLLIGDTKIIQADSNAHAMTISDLESSYTLEKPWNIPTMGMYALSMADPLFDGLIKPVDLPYTDNSRDGYEWVIRRPGWGSSCTTCYQEGISFNPTVFVGRWPLRDIDSLNNIIDKTIHVQPIKNFIFTRYEQEPLCEGWPIDNDDMWQTKFCYQDTYFTTYEELFSDKSTEYLVAEDDVTEQEALAIKNRLLAVSPDEAIIEYYHGNIRGIHIGADVRMRSEDEFLNSFPLYIGYSCGIFAFYYDNDPYGDFENPAYAENLIRSANGPAVYALPFLNYIFYDLLLRSWTVGEAFYTPAYFNIILIEKNPYVLLGDPSLRLYVPPEKFERIPQVPPEEFERIPRVPPYESPNHIVPGRVDMRNDLRRVSSTPAF